MIEKGPSFHARGTAWHLDAFYRGTDDPGLSRDLRKVRERAQAFASSYKGRINDRELDAIRLLSALQAYESIHEMGMKPYTFAYLYQSSDVRDQGGNSLFQEVREIWNEISQMLTFFPLEVMALPEDFLKKLVFYADLSNYRHFLLHQMTLKPYALDEGEETIIKSKDLSGREGLLSVYDELMGSLSFKVRIRGRRRSLTSDQVLGLLHSPDRTLRERAFKTFLQGLSRHGVVFKNIFNQIILNDHLENCRRGHPTPMHRACLLQGMGEPLIETIMEAVEEAYPLAQRYFRLKGRLLGLKRLKITDLFAPPGNDEVRISFSGAKRLLLEAMEDLHPSFHSIGKGFFENRRIDAKVRRGKKAGAFCKCFAPSLPPFISMNYSGNLRDMAILAHEVGHGIHYSLASGQSYLNFRPSPILAETASTFNEIILAQFLLRKKGFEDHQQALLASHLDGILVTVYRQNVFTRFEQAIHGARQGQLLAEADICRHWWEANAGLFGNDVEMIPDYRWGWAHIPHFIHSPFYCWSYVFGNLLSMILYQGYQAGGGNFLEGVIQLLASGSSQNPLEMLSQLGLDLRRKSLWQQAFEYVEGLIDSLEGFATKGVPH